MSGIASENIYGSICYGAYLVLIYIWTTGEVIKAWDLGVASMKKGELARLICRSDYAYGEQGSPPKIPANATLVFEVRLHFLKWSGCLNFLFW